MKYVILIADDEAEIRDLLRLYLENSGYDVLEAADGLEALAVLEKEHVDLAVLDVMMPRMNGLHVLKKLRETSNIPVLVFSAKDADSDKILGLNLGADDYLTKPFNILELKARIRALLRRAKPAEKEQPRDALICGHITLDCTARDAYNDGRRVELTAKEFDLAELLMRNPNRVYSRDALLTSIWGYDSSSDIRTVDVHIRRLREKLERDPAQPEHIMTKWGVGYYFRY